MKITKTKEVATEQIEILAGTYYFEDEDIVAYKFILTEPDDNYSDYTLETLHSFSNKVGIVIRKDGTWDEDGLPYVFKQFILGISGKKIEKEEFDLEKQDILNRINGK